MRLFASSSTKQFQLTFTSSQSWVAPVGTIKLDSLVGRGGYGSDATSGYYDPDFVTSVSATFVQGNSGPVPPPDSPNAGVLRWQDCTGPAQSVRAAVNAGGSATVTGLDYLQYSNGYVIFTTYNTFTDAIPGTASIINGGGWKTSGNVVPGDFGAQAVRYTQRGAYNPGSPASTGPSSSGFGYNFAGGYGFVQGTPQTINNVPVVAGNSYPMSIPYGGSITIIYTVTS